MSPGPPEPYDPWRETPANPPAPEWPQLPPPTAGPTRQSSDPSWPPPVQYLSGVPPYGPIARPRRGKVSKGALIATICALILPPCGFIAYFPEESGAISRSVWGLFSAVIDNGPPTSTAEPSSTVLMSADLKPGMCLTLDPTKQPQVDGALPVVDCATPHTSEVVGVITLPKGKYPGASGFVRAVNDKCGRLAEKYVDEAQVTSEMYLGYLAPTGVQWTLGNRVVACMAVDPSGKRKKSIKR